MTILGARTFVPSEQFSFPRHYLHQITFLFGAGALIAQSGGDFFITDGANPSVHVVCNFEPAFWNASTNGYTINWIVKDWYLLVDPSPTPLPLNFGMEYALTVPDRHPEMLVGILGWTTRYSFLLPPTPSTDWLPRPN